MWIESRVSESGLLYAKGEKLRKDETDEGAEGGLRCEWKLGFRCGERVEEKVKVSLHMK